MVGYNQIMRDSVGDPDMMKIVCIVMKWRRLKLKLQ